MATISKTPLTKAEFDQWAAATKNTFTSIDGRLATVDRTLTGHTQILTEHGRRLEAIERTLGQHTDILTEIAGTLKTIREELHAHVRLYDRLDHRDHAFAAKLGLNLKKIDADL